MRSHIYIVFCFLFLSACSSVRVQYDYDGTTDFSNYTTYNYYADMQSGLSQLDEKRLLRILDSTLHAKGLLLAEEPEFFIDIISSEFIENSGNNVGLGIGGTGRNVGGGVSVGIPLGSSSIQRSIQFDFIDSQKNSLFWQASSKSVYKENDSPILREKRLRAVIDKVFVKYPPK
ncbi:hypothetical protein MTsPCn5_30040 [Croceitalea sp. MTPC5]|uniref:DUF4136 domain-containing protein n=1 Tax=Croceitalea sp. MTPC5 TaxID=3056565 RepID=UPI002B3737C4|nr:hypothetical protein MTsPCn5_30040 [Croceitalea sp. MTPC5]